MDDELRATLAAMARQIAELTARAAPAPTLPLRELWQRHEAARKHRPAWHTVRAMVGPFVERYAERDAAGLEVRDWSAYREHRAGLSPSSRNLTLDLLKAMLRWGAAEGLMPDPPPLCKAKKEKAKKHRETAPNEIEIIKLLSLCTKPRERVIVLCACDSGMRRNEIRQLQWAWIRWDARELHLPNWACKGGRGRVVPATRRQLEAIDAMPRDIRSPYVLRNARGEPYAVQMLTNWWRALATAAELQAVPGEKRVRLHDGRHGYATNAVERGVGIESVSEILGHASLDQTRAYVQRRPRDLERARQRFEDGIENDKRRR